jgi:hypothetical protein
MPVWRHRIAFLLPDFRLALVPGSQFAFNFKNAARETARSASGNPVWLIGVVDGARLPEQEAQGRI